MVKIESYRALIDANTNTIQDVISHTEETIKDLRENFEKEKMKTLKETHRIDQKFKQITSVIDVLPQKVANCEVQCKNSEDISV